MTVFTNSGGFIDGYCLTCLLPEFLTSRKDGWMCIFVVLLQSCILHGNHMTFLFTESHVLDHVIGPMTFNRYKVREMMRGINKGELSG